MEGQNLGVPYWAVFADYTFLILVFSILRITIDLNVSSYCFYLDFWNSSEGTSLVPITTPSDPAIALLNL